MLNGKNTNVRGYKCKKGLFYEKSPLIFFESHIDNEIYLFEAKNS